MRQVAPMHPLMRAHWRDLANVTELVIPSSHPSPQPKRQIDRISRFCTPHGRVSSGTLAPPGEYVERVLPWPTRVHNPNGKSIGLAVFAQVTAECSYILQWDSPFPPQNCPFP